MLIGMMILEFYKQTQAFFIMKNWESLKCEIKQITAATAYNQSTSVFVD